MIAPEDPPGFVVRTEAQKNASGLWRQQKAAVVRKILQARDGLRGRGAVPVREIPKSQDLQPVVTSS